MNAKINGKQELARRAAASMADRNTPLIRNAWYVAARASDVGRELLGRWILERNIVFYRRADPPRDLGYP